MLTIEYKYFYQSALDKSFRKAGDSLNINSSAIVRQIHKLEDRLELQLFTRSSKGLDLTSHGHMLFEYVSQLIEKNESFLHNIKNQADDVDTVIKISTVETIAIFFLSGIVNKFQSEFKNVRFEIIAKKPDSIIDDLILNKSEIGITFTKDIPRNIRVLYENNFPIGILCSPEHKLTKIDDINLKDCLQFPFVFHPGTLTLWNKMQREMDYKTNNPKPIMIANSYALIKSFLIKNTNAIFFSTKLGALDEIKKNMLCFKKVKNKTLINNRIGIVSKKNKATNSITEKFVNNLIDNFNNLINN